MVGHKDFETNLASYPIPSGKSRVKATTSSSLMLFIVPQEPFVAASGRAEQTSCQGGHHYGAAGHVEKPDAVTNILARDDMALD